MKQARHLTVAYRPRDDLLQVSTDHEAKGDCIGIGRGAALAIAVDDGRPIGFLVQGFYANGWRFEIEGLAHLIAAHLKDVRESAIAEGIFDAVGQVGRGKISANERVLRA